MLKRRMFVGTQSVAQRVVSPKQPRYGGGGGAKGGEVEGKKKNYSKLGFMCSLLRG